MHEEAALFFMGRTGESGFRRLVSAGALTWHLRLGLISGTVRFMNGRCMAILAMCATREGRCRSSSL
jgi:hypothetical protein